MHPPQPADLRAVLRRNWAARVQRWFQVLHAASIRPFMKAPLPVAPSPSSPAESILSFPRKMPPFRRSEEHTSELQSLMRISYAVFCLKNKKKEHNNITQHKYT